MVRNFFLGLFLFIIASAALFFWEKISADKASIDKINQACFKSECFYVELAKTEAERSLGLMFREDLADNGGMLFVFETEDNYPFWMKDMSFPLDIIFLNDDKEVVFIGKAVQPCQGSFCPLITSPRNAKYVLEINAGITSRMGLNLGDRIDFREL